MEIRVILFAGEIFSVVLQHIFCESILTKRQNKRSLEILVWGLYFALFNLITYTITDSAWVNMLVFVFTFFMAIKILYINPIRTLAAVTVFLYLGGMCSELLVYYGKELLPVTFEADAEIMFVVLSKIVWFCIIKFVSLLIKLNKKMELNIQDWLEVFMVPIGCIWILLALFMKDTLRGDFIRFIAVVMVLIINIFTYYLYDKAKETMQRRIREEILVKQCEYYIQQNKESQKWWEELRRFRHDIKQRYLLEKTYLEAGDYEALERYCNETLNFLTGKSMVSKTGNIYIDSIINYKADVAEKHKIEFNTELNIPKDAEVNAEDLCICLGNLLDNAIEASKELVGNKTINIRISADGNNLFVNIKNKYSKQRHKVGNQYQTSKEDTKKHGFGLTIVRQIVEKYQGEFCINEKDKEFDVMVLLYDFLK